MWICEEWVGCGRDIMDGRKAYRIGLGMLLIPLYTNSMKLD
jgi:hypothetical protein